MSGSRFGFLALAVGMAIGVVLGAPLALQARQALGSAFPATFGTIIRSGITAVIGGAMLVALVRIREHRALRYLALATALALGVGFAAALRTGNSAIDVVEAFHFVEYGLIAWLFYAAWRPLGDGAVIALPLLAGLLVGTLDEWFQWFVPFRVGEIRDVALNLVAVVCGLLFGIAFDPPGRLSGLRSGSLSRIGVLSIVATLTLALFFQAVHLGYDVRAGSGEMFRSTFTREELASAAAERLQRWRLVPPLVAGRFSREDQFISEAIWHVRWRNQAETAGDITTAWGENRILETFFAPVLDTPSYVSRSGFRWSPLQRTNAASRAAASYRSQAQPYPLYTWPRAAFWTAIALLIGVLAAVCIVMEKGDRRR